MSPVTLVLSLSESVRSLHDIGKSGWRLLVGLTIGGMLLIISWNCVARDEGANKYGAGSIADGDTLSMAEKSSLISALVAGPIVIGVAYGISAWLTGGDAASDTSDASMSLAYGPLIWIGPPIAVVAALPLLAVILNFSPNPSEAQSIRGQTPLTASPW